MKSSQKIFTIAVAAFTIASSQMMASAEDAPQRIKFSGAVSLEGAYEKKDYKAAGTEDKETDGLSATVELGVDVNIDRNVTGFIGLKWEDNDEEANSFDIDEGYLKLGGHENMPLFFRAGKMYVPFGKFETNMVSDPLTLEIGETRESAAELGFDIFGFYASVYAFNGSVDLEGEDDTTDNFGASLGYAYESDSFSIEIGGNYINNLYDSNGLTDQISKKEDDFIEDDADYVSMKDYVPGAAAFLVLKVAGVSLFGEYVVMLDDPQFEKYDDSASTLTTEKNDALKAWNVEAGYTFSVAGKETTLGAAYQGVKNADDTFPETRYMGVINIGILESTSFAVQYAYDEFENDDKAQSITAKVEIEF